MVNKFHDVQPIDHKTAEIALKSHDPQEVCHALIRVTYYDPDYRWVQDQCINFFNNDNPDIKRLAIICIGHLARIHNKIDLELVLPLLQNLKKDKNLEGVSEDALSDIEIFILNK